MKKLKFEHSLVEMILDGRKTATWRIFDDKNLTVGDTLELIEFETGEVFVRAEIVGIKEKSLGEVTEDDFDGHETYKSKEEMLNTYRGYYGDRVDWNTTAKMIHFKLKY
ncbi:MAG: ASCH domain-containing protein [Candidatus Paceibacterota bacterium]